MSTVKPIVLLFCRYFLPGRKGGGPIRQYENLIKAVGDRIDFRIVTLDRDLGDVEPYDSVPIGSWTDQEGAKVLYLPERDVTPKRIAEIVEETAPSLVYLNSFWDRAFTAAFLTARKHGSWNALPVLFAVRGGFNPAALAINGLRKRAYIAWMKVTGRLRGIIWHATTNLEAEVLRREFCGQEGFGLVQAPDLGVGAADDLGAWRPRPEGSPLRLALLSRIAPIKNIDFAIAALAKAKEAVEFTIYGPEEDTDYTSQCKALAAELPPNHSVNFAGGIDGGEVMQRLSAHDGFILPTKGENYGHAIAEALAAGLPTMISERTPWLDRSAGGGCDVVPLDTGTQGWAERIDQWAHIDADEMRQSHKATLVWAAANLQTPEQIDEQEAVFLSAIAMKESRHA